MIIQLVLSIFWIVVGTLAKLVKYLVSLYLYLCICICIFWIVAGRPWVFFGKVSSVFVPKQTPFPFSAHDTRSGSMGGGVSFFYIFYIFIYNLFNMNTWNHYHTKNVIQTIDQKSQYRSLEGDARQKIVLWRKKQRIFT